MRGIVLKKSSGTRKQPDLGNIVAFYKHDRLFIAQQSFATNQCFVEKVAAEFFNAIRGVAAVRGTIIEPLRLPFGCLPMCSARDAHASKPDSRTSVASRRGIVNRYRQLIGGTRIARHHCCG